MGKTSQKSSEMKLPKWYEDAAKQQILQSQKLATMPYMPWMGPSVANPSPQLRNAWDQGNQWSQAAGMGGGGIGPMQSWNQPQGSYNMYQQSVDQLAATHPGIMEQYNSMFEPIEQPQGTGDPELDAIIDWYNNNFVDGGEAGSGFGGGEYGGGTGAADSDQGAGVISTDDVAALGFDNVAAFGDFMGETFGGSASAGTSAGQSSGSGNTPGEPGTGDGPGY